MDSFIPTNTLASASFDILKMDGIDDPFINVNRLATMDLDESYFALASSYVCEAQTEYTNSKIALYKAITESTNQTVVLESFSDFFVKVKEIIDKFLKFIKSLFDRFINTLMKLISNDKYIIKNKKKFDNFKTTDEFEFTGYEYTFNPNIPLASAILEFNNDLFQDLYKRTNNSLTLDAVKQTIDAMDPEEEYDAFRAKVIGQDGSKISLSDFTEELFKVFRDGNLDTDTIEVDRSYVKKVLDRFTSYNKTKTNINNQRKNIEQAYHTVEKQVSDVVKRNGDLSVSAFIGQLPDSSAITTVDGSATNTAGLRMSGDLMAQLDIYIKNKCDQIQEFSNIHALAFGAKLDAMKDAYKQDRNVLYSALNKIDRSEYVRKES